MSLSLEDVTFRLLPRVFRGATQVISLTSEPSLQSLCPHTHISCQAEVLNVCGLEQGLVSLVSLDSF